MVCVHTVHAVLRVVYHALRRLYDLLTPLSLPSSRPPRFSAPGYTVLTVDEDLAPELDTTHLECMYCHQKEEDLCSPMVVSQTREEHNAYIALCNASQLAVTATGVKLSFLVNNKKVKPPAIQPAYFPYFTSMHAEELREQMRFDDYNARSVATSFATATNTTGASTTNSTVNPDPLVPLAAHQMCALEMYRARCTKQRNLIRRKRRRVVESAVAMAGVKVRPLGLDDRGREYWKFPCSDDLFICVSTFGDFDKLSFRDMLKRERSPPGAAVAAAGAMDVVKVENLHTTYSSSSSAVAAAAAQVAPTSDWKVLKNRDRIISLTALLGPSNTEQALRRSILDAFPEPIITSTTGISSNTNTAAAVAATVAGSAVADTSDTIKKDIPSGDTLSTGIILCNCVMCSNLNFHCCS